MLPEVAGSLPSTAHCLSLPGIAPAFCHLGGLPEPDEVLPTGRSTDIEEPLAKAHTRDLVSPSPEGGLAIGIAARVRRPGMETSRRDPPPVESLPPRSCADDARAQCLPAIPWRTLVVTIGNAWSCISRSAMVRDSRRPVASGDRPPIRPHGAIRRARIAWVPLRSTPKAESSAVPRRSVAEAVTASAVVHRGTPWGGA